MSTDSVTGSNPNETKAVDPTTQVEEDKSGGTPPPKSGGTPPPMSNISSLAQLKEQAPDVYKKMLEAMFQEIQKQDEKHKRRIRELNRKGGS